MYLVKVKVICAKIKLKLEIKVKNLDIRKAMGQKKRKYILEKIKSSISNKLVIPIVLIVLLLTSFAIFRKIRDSKDYQTERVTMDAVKFQELLYSKVKTVSEQALITSSMLSELPSVRWAYILQKKINNQDSTSSILRRTISPLVDKTNKLSELQTRIQFVLPPATSFYKTWSNKRGSDLSDFSEILLTISNKHSAVKGIDVNQNGLFVNAVAPILDNTNQYIGAVQIEYPFLKFIDELIENHEGKEYALYIDKNSLDKLSNKKNIEANEDFVELASSEAYINQSINAEDFNIKDGLGINLKSTDKYSYAFIPIKDFNEKNIAFVVYQIDNKESSAKMISLIRSSIIVALLAFFISFVLLFLLISKIVSKPITRLGKSIQRIAKGELIDSIDNKRTDEIGIITDVFNTLIDRLKKSTSFANEIGKGNLEVDLKNINEEDVLSHSLIKMRDNLKEADQLEQERKREEEKRNWATEGIAKFSEILRQNSNDISVLSDTIVRNVIEYIGANQGGLFIVNDTEKSLKLISAVAYDRKKFLEKEIQFGEGLIGACVFEKETIYLSEIPNNYVNISSGLGTANPRFLLIVPMKIEEKVFAVIEIASFKPIEDYKIKFMETISESIASTLSSVKISQQTSELLEQSQQQSEELSAQEEEMRQNLEEMQATQEESSRRESELLQRIKELETKINSKE